ncbi:MAG: metallophosphoesterase [Proteobacteria bacterium]|nr:metallophosphoesterase [Pseudomonadota bacterium]
MQNDADKQIRICHFSDLHLPLDNPVHLWKLVGKRFLGWANLRFNRSKTYKLEAFIALLESLVGEKADLTVMTGDLTSLAFEFEFAKVDSIFRRAGLDDETTILVPGNHDRYAVSADLLDSFERGMARWFPKGFSRGRGYPIVQILGPVALIGLDTAVWRNPIRAAGHIGRDQIERLVKILDSKEVSGRWPVIAMHHPPFHLSRVIVRDYLSGLNGLDELISSIQNRSATILHGHLHQFSRRSKGNLDIIGVPAASNDTREEATQLAYHVYTFECTGLKRAEAVRHWPGRTDEKARFERFELPEDASID